MFTEICYVCGRKIDLTVSLWFIFLVHVFLSELIF